MKIIQSTNGYNIQVDDCHYEYLNQFNWRVDSWGYAKSGMNMGPVANYMHRVIAKLENLPESEIVDHKDRNKLNNQIDNLRPATKSQNCANARVRKDKIHSNYKGVTYDKHAKKWLAQLTANKVKLLYKRCATELQAAKLYDEAAFKAFGEFAVLNFPEDYKQPQN